MRKTILLGTLIFAVAAAAWAGGPADKTTGEVGYEAFGLQRWAEFNAHEGLDGCSDSWNLVGDWVLDFRFPGPYIHAMTVDEQIDGGFTGTGGYPTGGPYSHPWTVVGAVDGDTVDFTITYGGGAPNPGYQVYATGSIAMDGTMTGTCDTSSNQECTWSTPSGAAAWGTDCSGKGEFHYSDANGNWYAADVQYVNVEGDMGYFAGLVTEASQPGWVGYWVSVAVHDGGEPAYLVDKVWGVFTSEATAAYNVANQIAPGPAFSITSGNLQVHTRE